MCELVEHRHVVTALFTWIFSRLHISSIHVDLPSNGSERSVIKIAGSGPSNEALLLIEFSSSKDHEIIAIENALVCGQGDLVACCTAGEIDTGCSSLNLKILLKVSLHQVELLDDVIPLGGLDRCAQVVINNLHPDSLPFLSKVLSFEGSIPIATQIGAQIKELIIDPLELGEEALGSDFLVAVMMAFVGLVALVR